MTTPISPAPVTEWQPAALPPYLSNGCVGLRLGRRPLEPGVAVLSGLEGIDPADHVPGFGRIPYPLGGDVVVGGLRMSDAPQRCTLREQRYDFSAGEVTTSWRFDGGEARVDLVSTAFCSRTQPGLVLELLTASVDAPCRLSLTASVETLGVPGTAGERHLDLPAATDASGLVAVDGVVRWRTDGDRTAGGVAYTTSLEPRAGVQRSVVQGVEPLVTTYALEARPGTTYLLERIVATVPDAWHPQPDVEAVRLLRSGAQRGFDRLHEDNRREWEDLWRARPELVGAPTRWQAMADAAFFYLHTSTTARRRRARRCSGWPTGRTTTTTGVTSCGTARCSSSHRFCSPHRMPPAAC